MDRRKIRRNKVEEDSLAVLDRPTGTIAIVGEITQRSASQFRQHLRTLERLKRTPTIQVEINSPGGDIEAGFMIIDSIELCKKSVTTRVTGVAMSMGALILTAGKHREALANATIMVHQGSYRINATYGELKSEVAECERIETLCANYLDTRTGQPPGFWAAHCLGKNLYLTAEQALEMKLIDTIVKRG